jgi:hypothetical protein
VILFCFSYKIVEVNMLSDKGEVPEKELFAGCACQLKRATRLECFGDFCFATQRDLPCPHLGLWNVVIIRQIKSFSYQSCMRNTFAKKISLPI